MACCTFACLMPTKLGNSFLDCVLTNSYGVENAQFAVSQLAQTTMRSEIGQLSLDHVLKERQDLNANITEAINGAAEDWVIKLGDVFLIRRE